MRKSNYFFFYSFRGESVAANELKRDGQLKLEISRVRKQVEKGGIVIAERLTTATTVATTTATNTFHQNCRNDRSQTCATCCSSPTSCCPVRSTPGRRRRRRGRRDDTCPNVWLPEVQSPDGITVQRNMRCLVIALPLIKKQGQLYMIMKNWTWQRNNLTFCWTAKRSGNSAIR